MSESPSRSCPQCGATLPSEGTSGLCPRCLMAEAMAGTQAEATKGGPPPGILAPEDLAPYFPQLEVLECLGRGGMGVVYKARQKSLNRFVALKLLAPERVADAMFAQRFTHEAQALAALNHPGIVTIYDFGQAGGFFFLLMEFVDGVNLRQAMKAGRFTPEQALAIVPPVCEALQFAHDHGIVHRDIKPENLLLDRNGRVKIADFGIAKMLGAPASVPADAGATHFVDSRSPGPKPAHPVEPTLASAAGTPQYMSPEQKEHGHTDHRADIYSLGVVLYELLTGELPADRLQPPSRKVQIDVRLDEIVLRALEKTPALRYQTAEELRTQVETMVGAPPLNGGNPAGPTGTTVVPPRLLKFGTSTLVTPAHLATVSGQFLSYRTRGQLILDDRQLTHTAPAALVGAITVIPLAAIRDVSIGKYPLSMNPLGIDLLSVTYEEGGRSRQVLLSPMKGWFATPGTWDALVAEWATALREAVVAATGRPPASTPSEKLGVPGSHFALLTMLLMPLVPLGVFLTILSLLTPPGASAGHWRFLSLFTFGNAAAGLLLLFLRRRRTKSPPGSGPTHNPRRFLFGLIAFNAVLLAVSALLNQIPTKAASGLLSLVWVPVGVSNNLVVVDVTAEVGPGGAEVRAGLDGPKLSPAMAAGQSETATPRFEGTLVHPSHYLGNRPRRTWSAGRQSWRLGFVLPNSALAEEAFGKLRPLGPPQGEPGLPHAGTLFEVRQPDGTEFHASLDFTAPLSPADPRWVEVVGQSRDEGNSVTLSWEVLASQPAMAQFSRAGSPITVLKPKPQTQIHGVDVDLELTRLDAERVLFVRRIGGQTLREEMPGNFQALADELLGSRTTSAKTVAGAAIELCRFQGKSFTVVVLGQDPPLVTPASAKPAHGTFLFYGIIGLCVLAGGVILLRRRKIGTGVKVLLLLGALLPIALLLLAVLFFFWSARGGIGSGMGGMGMIRLGLFGLLIASGVVSLFVAWVRRGSTAGKVVALVVVPLLFLLMAMLVLLGSGKVAGDLGPGAGLERLSPPGPMVLESSLPVPPQQFPPGEVQQTQNGFRLSLPGSSLATFEFSVRQADDTWQPVPSLTALVATGEGGRHRDSLWWGIRRGNESHNTNQLWFWTVGANESGGQPLPHLADHGTNLTHQLAYRDTLDWWNLAVPPRTEMAPGTRKTLALFRTFGTATARGGQPKEARIVIRCEYLPEGLQVARGQSLVQAGLAAHAVLEKLFPATNRATGVSHGSSE